MSPGGRHRRREREVGSVAAGNAFCSIASLAAGALGLAASSTLVADGPAAFAAVGLAGVYAPMAVAFTARGVPARSPAGWRSRPR